MNVSVRHPAGSIGLIGLTKGRGDSGGGRGTWRPFSSLSLSLHFDFDLTGFNRFSPSFFFLSLSITSFFLSCLVCE